MRNYGAQLATFNGTREDLPADIQIGVSKRLKYLPFRLSIIARGLNQWDIRYNDPSLDDDEVLLFGGEEQTSKGNPKLDNFFRHMVFNGEFLLGRNESFRISGENA